MGVITIREPLRHRVEDGDRRGAPVVFINAGVERLASAIPHARCVILPNAAHIVNAESPERFNELLAEHLAGS